MTTFYICRHGQTENNQKKLLSGWIDTPLTPEGIENAHATATKLKEIVFDKIISSDLGRAFTTAYIISREIGYSAEIERHKCLRDVNYGKLANLPYSGPDSVYPELSAADNTNFMPSEGESLAQMQQRVLDCMAKVSEQNPGKIVLVVAHDGAINAISAAFANQEIGIVDANSNNSHEFLAKVAYDNGKPVSFDMLVA